MGITNSVGETVQVPLRPGLPHPQVVSAAVLDALPPGYGDFLTVMVEDKYIGLTLAVSGNLAIGTSFIITKKVRFD